MKEYNCTQQNNKVEKIGVSEAPWKFSKHS